jgi:predicted transcriptional regulator of viral defense system
MAKRLKFPGEFDRPVDFISHHQVFRIEDLEAAYVAMGREKDSAAETVRYHLKAGRLFCVRRGVYTRTSAWDPWLIASRLTPDAVVSHEGALSFHGHIELEHQLSFLTALRTEVTRFGEVIYQPLRVEPDSLYVEVQELERYGQKLRVTSIERTLVDCLGLFSRSPAPLELFGLFKSTAEFTNPVKMIKVARQLHNRSVCSRLGLFLCGSHRQLPERELGWLQADSLRTPEYFQRTTRTPQDQLVSRWNLIVPPALLYATTGPLPLPR